MQIDWMAPIPKVFCRYIRLNHEKNHELTVSHWLRNRISVCARFRIWKFSCRSYMPMTASLCVCVCVLCMSNVHVYDKVETVFFCLWFCMAMHWVHFSFHIMNTITETCFWLTTHNRKLQVTEIKMHSACASECGRSVSARATDRVFECMHCACRCMCVCACGVCTFLLFEIIQCICGAPLLLLIFMQSLLRCKSKYAYNQ